MKISNGASLKSAIEINPEKTSQLLENFIREYVRKLEREGVVLGLSGGIDSAVAASLCQKAVGQDKVLALIMPEKDSDPRQKEDALSLAEQLKIKTRIINLSPYLKKFGIYGLLPFYRLPLTRGLKGSLTRKLYDLYTKKTGQNPFLASQIGFKNGKLKLYLKNANAYYRIKHRLRSLLLYFYSELENRLVVGTTNKTEYKIGFFVKWGCDSVSDIMPLQNFYKTQIRELARYLKIPNSILEKPPSPDIIPGITDEKAIGVSYDIVDLILAGLEKNWEISEIAKACNLSKEKVLYVKKLTENSEHMRKIFVFNHD